MIIVIATKLNVTELIPNFLKEVLRQSADDSSTPELVQTVQLGGTGYWKIFDGLKEGGFTNVISTSKIGAICAQHKHAFVINDDTVPVRAVFYDLMGKGINPEFIRFYRVYNKDEDKEIVN